MEEKFVIFSSRRRAEVLFKIIREMLWMFLIATIVAFSLFVFLGDALSQSSFKHLIMLFSSFIPLGIALKQDVVIKYCQELGYRLLLSATTGIIIFWFLINFKQEICALFFLLATAAFFISAIVGLKSKKRISRYKATQTTFLLIVSATIAEICFTIPNGIGSVPIIGGALSLSFCFINAVDFYELRQFMKMSAEENEIKRIIKQSATTSFISFCGMLILPDAFRLIIKLIDYQFKNKQKNQLYE